MKRIYYVLIALALIAGVFTIKKVKTSKDKNTPLDYTVKKGSLDFYVYATGNLKAENSTNIDAPRSIFEREVRIWEIAITDLVLEGTEVDSGEYIATLDQNAIQEILTTAEEELELAYNSLIDARMDTNLTLNNNRDAIITAMEAVEEKELFLAESKYESPATIQKAHMDKDKTLRKLEQEKQSYILQQRRSITQVKQKELDYSRKEKRVKKLQIAFEDAIITAPQKGMVIYKSNWGGEKKSIGSKVNSYDPTIATLPDLSTMISVAYVNEIDISNIKIGQDVKLTIDAFPNKEFDGKVISIANIGQNVAGSNAKVFKIEIKVLDRDKNLRPAMTSNNTILTASTVDTLYVPTETIFSNDTLNWVYVSNKKTYKQIVRIGNQNESHSIIIEGLAEGDKILWNHPKNANELDIKGMEIYEREKAEKIEAERKTKEVAAENPKRQFRNNNEANDQNRPKGGRVRMK